MRALLSLQPGGTDTLRLGDIPEPVPGPGQVVIAVHACGVNFPDTLIIEDRYQFRPTRPFAPGGEVSGTIAALGSDIPGLHIGDRVLAWSIWGGMAEQTLVDAHRCVPIPPSMPYDEAAAFIMTYGTSYYALRHRADLRKGDTVLVIGAGGGAGLAAVELATAMGARAIAAASSAEKVALAVARGAVDGVVYPRGPFDKPSLRTLADSFKRACGEAGANVVYDAVGGDYAEAALRAIAWEGRYLVVGFPAGIPRIPLNLTLLKSCQIVGVFWGAWMDRAPGDFQASARDLMDLYQQGLIKPHISGRFSLAEGAKAIDMIAGRHALGKLLVLIE